MRGVLYTDEMVPLIIIDLPNISLENMYHRGHMQIPVWPDWDRYDLLLETDKIATEYIKLVHIRVERMHMNGKVYPLFFVDQRQIYDALQLRPADFYEREYEKIDMTIVQERLLAGFMPNLLKALGD